MELNHSPLLYGHEVIQATGGTLIRGSKDRIFNGISTDSREPAGEKLFIPLKGERFDGHDFLVAAITNGAAGVLVQRNSENKLGADAAGTTAIIVKDTLKALGDIAHFWRKKFPLPVIAITGSSGKTTTKEMAAGIIGIKKNTLSTRGNFNNLVGLPLTLFRLNQGHEAAILEMGTNTRGEIARLTRIAAPDVGIITNIGAAHLEGFKSIEMVREEKSDLLRNMDPGGIAIINRDDEGLGFLETVWQGRWMTYGIKNDADITAEGIKNLGGGGVHFILKMGDTREEIHLRAVGEHNIYNALAAAASSMALGLGHAEISRGLSAFRPVPGRMDIHRLKNGAYLIDDTYNANPSSLREAVKTLRELKGKHESAVIMGDMLELGDRSEELHEESGMFMADTGVSAIFLKGAFARATAAGAIKKGMTPDRLFFPEHPGDVSSLLKFRLKKGDWILVKGSRKMQMEKVVQEILDTFGEEEGRRQATTDN